MYVLLPKTEQGLAGCILTYVDIYDILLRKLFFDIRCKRIYIRLITGTDLGRESALWS